MSETATTTATTDQLGVTSQQVRADQLRLGDTVLGRTWTGRVTLETVTSLELEGEDVLLNGTSSMSPSTKLTLVTAEAL